LCLGFGNCFCGYLIGDYYYIPDDWHLISASLLRCSARQNCVPKDTDFTHWYHLFVVYAKR
jgi:hypothetical protein